MNKIKKVISFLPAIVLTVLSGITAFLSKDNISSAYASNNLLLYTDFYTSTLNPSLYEFVNSTDSSDTIGIYFSPLSCDVDYYENFNGVERTRYGAFTQRVRYGLTISVTSSLVNQFSIMNLPLRDFSLKTYFKDFVFVEEIEHSTHPGMSSIWRVSISYDIYIDDVYYDNIITYSSFSANSNLRTLDLTLYESNFTSPYALYYNVDLTTELIASNMYQNGYNDGYNAGYNTGEEYGRVNGYSAGHADGYNAGWSEGNTVGLTNGYNNGYDDGHDVGYAEGHEDGVTDGYNNGYDVGLDTGYTNGYSDGVASQETVIGNAYSEGYADGYNEAGNQSDVANSIFDGIIRIGILPVQFFLSVFNFQVFGINVSVIITSLLAICITVILIRFITGKKV